MGWNDVLTSIRQKYAPRVSDSPPEGPTTAAHTEAKQRNEALRTAYQELAGQWIAVDRVTGAVRAAKPTPYDLSAYLKENQIRGVDVLRATDPSEPELVGLG